MADKAEGEWTLMVGAGEVAAKTAIEVAALEAEEADWEKFMLRSTGVAEEAACMVYLAISKLEVGVGEGDDEGLKIESHK